MSESDWELSERIEGGKFKWQDGATMDLSYLTANVCVMVIERMVALA